MREIGILVFPGVQALDVSGPMDVFAEANRFVNESERYRLTVIGTEHTPMPCSNGLLITAQKHFSMHDGPLDLLLVAGGPDLPSQPANPALYDWLRRQAGQARRFGSICNGAFLLAHAGLLAGRTVTTHWNDSAGLANAFPDTRVDSDRIYVRDGPLYTSAGVTAGIDLSLYLLYEDFGPELPLNVAKRLVVFTQRMGGQSQFSPYLAAHAAEVSAVSQVQQYVLGHLAGDLRISELARVVGMSPRNLARVFLKDAKQTPAEFIERARVDAARVLLELSDAPLKTVAFRCGFGSTEQMRNSFVKLLAVTASQYRANFAKFNHSQSASDSIYS